MGRAYRGDGGGRDCHAQDPLQQEAASANGGGQDGRALRRYFLHSAASARKRDLWPAWGRPGGFPRCVRLPPGVPDAAVPVGAGLRRISERSEARLGSQGAAAVQREARPGQRNGPFPW
ncbi:hypothetical protein NDU88_000009 [Pleurodeles waltl]|uniref:Uncharacterized protein n=1 Tax=Pleurodeles waltl TaxID=8319 RepID=A0AAV7KM19_PLEWA|nr:hypothetical protein NDU88_000009 [Pleurodeles waltl]